MYFDLPVKVWDEDNCVERHGAELAALGSRALIVSGRHSARSCGAFDDVTGVLEENGDTWVEFAEVEENPSVETVMRAREIGVREKVDFVIGIGGGSPMDAAKAIALMIRHADSDWSYMYDSSKETTALPIAEVPTTCGTGSEVTAISVLTRHDKKTKGAIPHSIFADLALLDGKYLYNAPKSVFSNTTMDALAHLFESYLNTKASDYSRMCVEYGLKVWARSSDVVAGKREPGAEDFRNMIRASCFAGMAIAHTGTSLPHALSYRLTYSMGMAHGKACGYFLPGFLREAQQEQVGYLLNLAGFNTLADFEEYYQRTCGRDAVPQELLEQTVKEVLANPVKCATAPFAVDEVIMKRIAGIE